MTTNANPKKTENGSHWYYPDGKPCYEVPRADGSGMRPATLADARKLGLLPGVSTILGILHKEALVNWLIEQSVLAVLTTPRIEIPQFDGEGRETGTRLETDDEFTKRVLSTERVQDQESQIAKDRGTQIHDAMELYFQNRKEEIAPDILPWMEPAAIEISKRGTMLATEMSIAGRGYGGRMDLLQKVPVNEGANKRINIWDFKSAKKLPDKKPWPEHGLQLAAYAKAFQESYWKSTGEIIEISVFNAYISTVEQGRFVIFEHAEWTKTYDKGFMPLVTHWQWKNNYKA